MFAPIRKILMIFATFVLILAGVIAVFELMGYVGGGNTSAVASNAIGVARFDEGSGTQTAESQALLAAASSSTSTTASVTVHSANVVLTAATTTTPAPTATTPSKTELGHHAAPVSPPSSSKTHGKPAANTNANSVADTGSGRSSTSPSLDFLASIVTSLRSVVALENTLTVMPSSSVAPSSTVAASDTPPTTNSDVMATSVVAQSVIPPVPVLPPAPTPDPGLSLPYNVTSFTDLEGWQPAWGAVAVTTGGYLSIGAASSTTGGEAVLAHSDAWKNYVFTATFDWMKGQSVTLLARYHEGKNNVSCQFLRDGEISIYRTVDGARLLLGQGTANGFDPTKPVVASIKVKDDHVSCGVNGSFISDYVYSGLPPNLWSGGIDIVTWDPLMNNAQILIHKIDVQPI